MLFEGVTADSAYRVDPDPVLTMFPYADGSVISSDVLDPTGRTCEVPPPEVLVEPTDDLPTWLARLDDSEVQPAIALRRPARSRSRVSWIILLSLARTSWSIEAESQRGSSDRYSGLPPPLY